MRLLIFYLLIVIAGCSIPKEDQLENCIRQKVEKKGHKLVYFLQTKQRYVRNDLLLKKIKVTVQLPNGKEVNQKDSILFQKQKDGTWVCIDE